MFETPSCEEFFSFALKGELDVGDVTGTCVYSRRAFGDLVRRKRDRCFDNLLRIRPLSDSKSQSSLSDWTWQKFDDIDMRCEKLRRLLVGSAAAGFSVGVVY